MESEDKTIIDVNHLKTIQLAGLNLKTIDITNCRSERRKKKRTNSQFQATLALPHY
jgi:hypothetical protein